MASRSQGSLLSVMPGCTSERVLPDAFSNFAQVGSERKLHIVRSAALIRNLSHTLVLVPADLHITVQVEATEVVFVLGLLAVSIVCWLASVARFLYLWAPGLQDRVVQDCD